MKTLHVRFLFMLSLPMLILAPSAVRAGNWGITLNPWQITSLGGVDENGQLDYNSRAGSGISQFALGASYAPIRNLEVAWLAYASYRALGLNDYFSSGTVPNLDLSPYIDPATLASRPGAERNAAYGIGYNHYGLLYQIRCFTNDWDDYSFMLGLEGGVHQTRVNWYQSPDNANLMKYWNLDAARFALPAESFTRGMLGGLFGINLLSTEHYGFLAQGSIGWMLGSQTRLENSISRNLVAGPVTGDFYVRVGLNFSYRF